MYSRRKHGDVEPGLKWGPFTTRIPGIHTKMSWPIILQGALMTTATGGAIAPLMMEYFQMPFELAWGVVLIQWFWVWSHAFLFGDPYAPGWITPALPLILVFLGGYEPGVEAIQATTALMILVSLIFLFFGITKLGAKFFEWIPVELRSGLILGSAIAAFLGEFDRIQDEGMFVTLPVVWAIVFILLFSVWFGSLKYQSRILSLFSSNALIIGFLMAALVGTLTGEVQISYESGFIVPDYGEYFRMLSPFHIGWPSWEMFLSALPLALVCYIIVFGDLLIGESLLSDADEQRPDEKIDIDPIRTHFATAFRNIGHLLMGGPFIPLHGPIWAGVTVFIVEQYKEGREKLDSIYSGSINFYWAALPLLFIAPVVYFMMPILPVALSITLILTGFAAAYIAMRLVQTPTSRGYALFIGLITYQFGPEWGLLVGIGLFFLLLVQQRPILKIPYK